MSSYDWFLFLHVLAAFAAIGSVVVFGVLLVSRRAAGPDAPATGLATLGRRLGEIGGAGTLILGVALVIDLDGYDLWDGWILGAFVLWAALGFAGAKVGEAFGPDGRGDDDAAAARTRTRMYTLLAVAAAAVLILMIYKPGA